MCIRLINNKSLSQAYMLINGLSRFYEDILTVSTTGDYRF